MNSIVWKKERAHSLISPKKKKRSKKVLKLGIEPKTFALLARRSNQLSYSSSVFFLLISLINKLQWVLHILIDYFVR